MTRKLAYAALAVLVAAVAVLGFFYVRGMPDVADIGFGRGGGAYTLTSARSGAVFDPASLKGKPYGVFFGFTHCPEVCPTTLSDISTSLAGMADAADFHLYFITVDPEQDIAQYLNDYISNFDPRIEALVPKLADLPAVARDFFVFYEKVPDSSGGYTMNHTASVFLFDRKGRFRSTMAYDEPADARLAKLQNLMK